MVEGNERENGKSRAVKKVRGKLQKIQLKKGEKDGLMGRRVITMISRIKSSLNGKHNKSVSKRIGS